MGATQGVILSMMAALILWLVWSNKSPFNKSSNPSLTDQAAENAKKIADAAKTAPPGVSSDPKTTGDPSHPKVTIRVGGLDYIIDSITQGVIDVIDPNTGRSLGPGNLAPR